MCRPHDVADGQWVVVVLLLLFSEGVAGLPEGRAVPVGHEEDRGDGRERPRHVAGVQLLRGPRERPGRPGPRTPRTARREPAVGLFL